jgi:hypothetical protein
VRTVNASDGGARLFFAAIPAVPLRRPVHIRGAAGVPFVDLPHHVPYRRRHTFDDRILAADMARYRWCPPTLVVGCAYLGWSRHDLLRQGRYLGLREDTPHKVVRE